MIDRVVHLGFEVRVELTLADGQSLWAQTTRDRADELELADGQVVWIRPDRRKAFGDDGRARLAPVRDVA
jgi:sulfate transport system ATP-binding protein